MDGNLIKYKIKIKRGRVATSFGILKGACILELGQGQSPYRLKLSNASGGRGAPVMVGNLRKLKSSNINSTT